MCKHVTGNSLPCMQSNDDTDRASFSGALHASAHLQECSSRHLPAALPSLLPREDSGAAGLLQLSYLPEPAALHIQLQACRHLALRLQGRKCAVASIIWANQRLSADFRMHIHLQASVWLLGASAGMSSPMQCTLPTSDLTARQATGYTQLCAACEAGCCGSALKLRSCLPSAH